MKLILLTMMIFSASAAYVAHSADRAITAEPVLEDHSLCQQASDVITNDKALLVLANATRRIR